LSAKQGLAMADEQLFEGLPEQERPQAEGRGALRLRVPERSQIGMQVAALDDLISEDHPVRSVWAFVRGARSVGVHDVIKAREGQPGHPPAAPELMLALWLWPRSMGSAAPANWTGCVAIIWSIAVMRRGVDELSQPVELPGRPYGGSGTASWRRASRRWFRLVWCRSTRWRRMACGCARVPGRVRSAAAAAWLNCMQQRKCGWSACVLKSRRNPAAGDRRQRAAKERGARERAARIAAAQERMKELEAERERREKNQQERGGKAEGAARFDHRCRRAGDEDGRWRMAPRLQTCRSYRLRSNR